MAFQRDIFYSIGLYNSALGAGTWMRSGEDTDMIFRILRAGFSLKYSPIPVIWHDRWEDRASSERLERGYILGFAAVASKFALKGEPVAAASLRRKVQKLGRDVCRCARRGDPRTTAAHIRKAGYLACGTVAGIFLRFRRDTFPQSVGATRIARGSSATLASWRR
jgi:GT2 family glycosyltransferase